MGSPDVVKRMALSGLTAYVRKRDRSSIRILTHGGFDAWKDEYVAELIEVVARLKRELDDFKRECSCWKIQNGDLLKSSSDTSHISSEQLFLHESGI